MASGGVAPLPATIPDDFYNFELTSDWEREALQKLLAAPVSSSPPASPPPLTKQQQQQRWQQQQQQSEAELLDPAADQGGEDVEAGSVSWQGHARGHGNPGISGQNDNGTLTAASSSWQQQQQQQLDYDPAEAWDAWAAYYEAFGYRSGSARPCLLGNLSCLHVDDM
jgi:hypothetical protein